VAGSFKGDLESVHLLRQAARRLRVWLWLGDWQILNDDLRWLQHRAGRVRDLGLGKGIRLTGFQKWLTDELARAWEALWTDLEHPRRRGVEEALTWMPPFAYKEAKGHLEALKHRVRRHLKAQSPEELHILRRRIRRLRYAKEWLQLEAEDLVRLQDELGQLSDLRLQLRLLGAFEARGGRVPARLQSQLAFAAFQAQARARQAVRSWTSSFS
jgi:CHAD domain-containing protein